MTNKVKKIIISRGRFDTITSHKVVPDAELWCPVSEVENYKNRLSEWGGAIIGVPDDVKGLGNVRNYVLDTCKDEVVVMIDDDIKKLWCTCGLHGRDEPNASALIDNLAIMAQDIGVSCFGFDQSWDVRKYNAAKPFSFSGWVGGVIGIVGRKHRFLTSYFKVDVDFCLTCIMYDRIILIDNRYSFVQDRRSNIGGNSIFRTSEKYLQDTNYIRKKWGKYLRYELSDTGEITSVRVER